MLGSWVRAPEGAQATSVGSGFFYGIRSCSCSCFPTGFGWKIRIPSTAFQPTLSQRFGSTGIFASETRSLPDAQFANTYCSPHTRPANTNRKRGFSTRPSRSVRITRQTHGQLFEKTDTVKNGQHNRGYDTKGVHTDCPSKRITRNEALASGCYKTEKRLLFHIRHTEDGEMYAAVGTYLQQGGMPLE